MKNADAPLRVILLKIVQNPRLGKVNEMPEKVNSDLVNGV
jgi:hypothetical protein